MNAISEYIIKANRINRYTESPILMAGHRRIYFPKLFTELGYMVGAEIGVKMGQFSKHLCRSMPGLKLYCIDPWLDYPDYPSCNGQVYKDRLYEIAKTELAPYNCEIIHAMSADAVTQFADESLDFVFIDGNHSYDYVHQDIELWSCIVRHGGIVSGDDYRNVRYKRTNIQVKSAVDEWTNQHNITPWFVLVGGTAPVWFWVKE